MNITAILLCKVSFCWLLLYGIFIKNIVFDGQQTPIKITNPYQQRSIKSKDNNNNKNSIYHSSTVNIKIIVDNTSKSKNKPTAASLSSTSPEQLLTKTANSHIQINYPAPISNTIINATPAKQSQATTQVTNISHSSNVNNNNIPKNATIENNETTITVNHPSSNTNSRSTTHTRQAHMTFY
ncbi:2970_t:CDS:2 [Ambispora gerdemannii]|uniref:2970_t:CDS:1 n=1 Tax=Ambispora gerdemannii TaxID=144530 RepID=A0A9N9DGW5_9GLOM|nr:2970_t:CDS:2 [Ambispora gerdemannii]